MKKAVDSTIEHELDSAFERARARRNTLAEFEEDTITITFLVCGAVGAACMIAYFITQSLSAAIAGTFFLGGACTALAINKIILIKLHSAEDATKEAYTKLVASARPSKAE